MSNTAAQLLLNIQGVLLQSRHVSVEQCLPGGISASGSSACNSLEPSDSIALSANVPSMIAFLDIQWEISEAPSTREVDNYAYK